MRGPNLYHSGIATFMGAPRGSLEDLEPGLLAVVGVPNDYTSVTRAGSRWGPRAIRQSSLYYERFLHTEPDQEYIDVSTGRELRIPEKLGIMDLDDIGLYPTDQKRTIEAISGFIKEIVDRDAVPIILGGDHFITYPCFRGYQKGIEAKTGGSQTNLGYIHVDKHFDIYDNNPVWGKYYNGSPVRRIAESMDPSNILLIGVHGLLGKGNYEFIQKSRISFITLNEINVKGVGQAISTKVKELAEKVETIYLSVDIDVVNCAFAPGTGAVSLEGITPSQLFEILSVLEKYPIGAFDVVEVAPEYDPSGRTQRLAAEILFNHIINRSLKCMDGEAV